MTFGVVLVTFNRLADLKQALAAYQAQTLAPAWVLVVNNNSTDGTRDYLESWAAEEHPFRPVAEHLPVNTGGCGGFYRGMELALDPARGLAADWVFIADDDAFPAADCLEQLAAFAAAPAAAGASSLCTAVYDRADHGQVIPMHRRRIKKGLLNIPEFPVGEAEYARPSFALDLFSYVGAAIARPALEKAGLPQKDFFIFYDDSEHSLRVREQGPILCVTAAKIYHPNAPAPAQAPLKWKDFYSIRNVLLEYRAHFPGRYYVMRLARCYANALLSKTAERRQMYLKAIADARAGRAGLDPVYRPGWEPSQKQG